MDVRIYSQTSADTWKKLTMDVIFHSFTGETALSLEFYDRSAQAILDEYLLDFIDYETFLEHSHPPANHNDYRPLIDFCKANKLPVIAANCSRRHSRLMSRQGPEAIERLAEESEIHRNFLLPTLPIQPASQQYEANFRATMGIVGNDIKRHDVKKSNYVVSY